MRDVYSNRILGFNWWFISIFFLWTNFKMFKIFENFLCPFSQNKIEEYLPCHKKSQVSITSFSLCSFMLSLSSRNISGNGSFIIVIIITVGFIERKTDTNPLMHLSPRRESPGTDMGQHLKSAHQGKTKVGVCHPEEASL